MKRMARIWAGIALAGIGAGGIVGAIQSGAIGSRIGSGIIGVAFLYFALRVWAGTPDAQSPRG